MTQYVVKVLQPLVSHVKFCPKLRICQDSPHEDRTAGHQRVMSELEPQDYNADAFSQDLVRPNGHSPNSEGVSTGQLAASVVPWLYLMQQQQQQQQQQQSQQPQQRLPQAAEWTGLLTALATMDPQQVGNIIAALAPKPGAAAPTSSDADKQGGTGVAGLRAAAQAQGGEAGRDGNPGGAFTEVAPRPSQGEPAAGSSTPKEGFPIDANALLPLLQMQCVLRSCDLVALPLFGHTSALVRAAGLTHLESRARPDAV